MPLPSLLGRTLHVLLVLLLFFALLRALTYSFTALKLDAQLARAAAEAPGADSVIDDRPRPQRIVSGKWTW